MISNDKQPLSTDSSMPISTAGKAYAWRQLAQRAGFDLTTKDAVNLAAFDVTLHYRLPERQDEIEPSIFVIPCGENAWRDALTLPAYSLHWLPANAGLPAGSKLPIDCQVPVLFWGAGYESGDNPIVELNANGSVVFYADIIASTLFMLSRWEEITPWECDEHGRFPATSSLAYKQGFLDQPIVDQYALILQAWIKKLRPNWTPKPLQYSVKLSHDIDFIQRFPNGKMALRHIAGDILKRNNLPLAIETARAYIKQRRSPDADEYYQSIYTLSDSAQQAGLSSAFYFMAAAPSQYDDGYDPMQSLVQSCIAGLRQAGHEVGFHPGYFAGDDLSTFSAEKKRMDAALGGNRYGGRQHFLRFQVPNTWRCWEQNGLAYDSTLGYADHEGFRCGTCHPYHPFDVELDRELNILEVPLIVMDTTLRHYRSMTPEQAEARVYELARRCKEVGGTFTLLWHNSSLTGEWRHWGQMYQRMVQTLANSVDTSTNHL